MLLFNRSIFWNFSHVCFRIFQNFMLFICGNFHILTTMHGQNHFKIVCCLFSSALRKWNFVLFLHVLKPSSFQIPCLNYLSHSCLHIALSYTVLYIILLLVDFRKIEKNDYLLRHVCPSAWNNRLQLDGFSRNLIFEHFSKNCRENSSFIKI